MRRLTMNEIEEVGGGFPPLAVPAVIAAAEVLSAITATKVAAAVGAAVGFGAALKAYSDND